MTIVRRLAAVGLGVSVLAAGALVLGACGGREEASSPSAGDAERPRGKAGRTKARAEAAPAPVEAGAPVKQRDLAESAFIETDENRDPFRNYIAVFNIQAMPMDDGQAVRPPVLLEEHSIEELRLIAIISGEAGNPMAMLVDPSGKGWVVVRGDYVGRGERIRLGPGQADRELSWRVSRVRPDRIILVRDDPVQAGPPATRVLRLYPEEDT